MPSILLKSYQLEYETTDITIQQIKDKYKIIEDIEHWTKPEIEITIESANKFTTPQVSAPPATINPSTLVLDSGNELTLSTKIVDFKEQALDHAISLLGDVEFLEVKEFKDIVSVVTGIEASLAKKGPETGNTYNIMVQNMVERFKDDC